MTGFVIFAVLLNFLPSILAAYFKSKFETAVYVTNILIIVVSSITLFYTPQLVFQIVIAIFSSLWLALLFASLVKDKE